LSYFFVPDDAFKFFPCSTASSDPVIAEPQLSNAMEFDESCRFLILMSSGVYKSLEEAGHQNINVNIASAVASEFAIQSTLSGVAQGVVDKIGRVHHDTYMTHSDNRRKEQCQKREDMTLLLRNFNYPMPNSMNSPSTNCSPIKPVTIPYFHGQSAPMSPLSVVIPTSTDSDGDDVRPMFTVGSLRNINTNTTNTCGSTQRSTYTSSNDSTQSGDDTGRLFMKRSTFKSTLPLDDDGRIKPYIDFSSFYEEIAKLSDEQKESLLVDLEPKPAYETIHEEKEILSPSIALPQPQPQSVETTETPTSA
jgi:TAK1-binding protein 1